MSAHYRDGAILMRPVKGVFKHITYENLQPVLEAPPPPVPEDDQLTWDPPTLVQQLQNDVQSRASLAFTGSEALLLFVLWLFWS